MLSSFNKVCEYSSDLSVPKFHERHNLYFSTVKLTFVILSKFSSIQFP